MTLEEIEEIVKEEKYNREIKFSVESYEGKPLLGVQCDTIYIHNLRKLYGEKLGPGQKIMVKSPFRIDDDNLNAVMTSCGNILNLSQLIFTDHFYIFVESFQKRMSITGCILNKCNLFNTTFTKDVYLDYCRFQDNVHFAETKFIKNVSFNSSIFEKEQIFYQTTFENNTDFRRCKFRGQVQFFNCNTSEKSNICFDNASFKEGIDISSSRLNKNLSFWNCYINEDPKQLNIYQTNRSDSQGAIINGEAYKKLRESFRIIKNCLAASGNKIDSLEYFKKEMTMLRKELSFEKNRYKKLSNLALLSLNKYSNDFGTDWVRGIVFILCVNLIFFIPQLLIYGDSLIWCFSISCILETIVQYLKMLNLADMNFVPFALERNNPSFIIHFFSRIFIGYGYYQTIQAFRKYGK